LVCENVVVTNCRLSTASAGVKFSEGNIAGVRNIRVVNTLFNNVNRGFAFQSTLGGTLSDVFLSDLVINCNRFDWFWAGDAQPFRFRVTRQSELDGDPRKAGEPDPGLIRNISIRNVVARAKGSSLFYGHPEKWLDGITLENVKLYLSTDPTAPYDMAQHALDFRHAKNVKLRGVQVFWDKPILDTWKSALNFENVAGVEVEGFAASSAPLPSPAPVVMLNQVTDASIRNCRAPDGTEVFLKIAGAGTRGIRLKNDDFSKAKVPCELGNDVAPAAVEGGASGAPSR
jgi:hypothetical protein